MRNFTYLKLGMLLFLVGLGSSLLAQTVQVTGKVTDESGDPIPGATVLVKGTTRGMATDLDGVYSLSATGDAVLVFPSLVIKHRKWRSEIDQSSTLS